MPQEHDASIVPLPCGSPSKLAHDKKFPPELFTPLGKTGKKRKKKSLSFINFILLSKYETDITLNGTIIR